MARILVTGGGGYCGGVLVPKLLKLGHHVTVFDTFYFGKSHLPLTDPNLNLVDADIREIDKFTIAVAGIDSVLHLACISNDASFELDENLSTSINLDAFEPLVRESKKAGVKRFVYASSSSVYGVSDQPNVTEEHPLVPLTLYNKYKGLCEPILNAYADSEFTVTTFRPATVCGYSPRLRLDLSVNILTNHAVINSVIRVFGGNQLRPNLHIEDYADVAILLLLDAESSQIQGEVFNVGSENMSILEIAEKVKEIVRAEFPERESIEIVLEESSDLRSYHINSDKIFRVLGFKPKKNVEDAIRDLCKAFKDGLISDSMSDNKYYNVKTLKNNNIQ